MAPRTPASTEPARPSTGRAGTPAQGRELRARGRKTMAKLLDAGIKVFAKRGYHAARVDDIVKAAQVSHGTFYRYFSSKEDLFQALVTDVAEELAGLTASLDPITPDEAGYGLLRDWLSRFTTMYEHYGPVIRTWTEAEVDSSDAGRLGADVLGELATTVAEQAEAGGSSGVDTRVAGLALVAMVERFNYFVLSGQVDAQLDEMVDTLAGVLQRSLFPPGQVT